jgi:MFS family permease
LAIAALGFAGLLLALVGHPLVPGVGSALLGFAGAIVVTVGQGALADRHGQVIVTALAESNAFGSIGAISAPLAIGLTVGIGLGWQPGLAVVPILAVGALLALGSFEVSRSSEHVSDRQKALSTPLLPWFGVVVAVAIEFSFVFWASDYLLNVGGFDAGIAASMTAIFFIGMVIGRGTAAHLSRLLNRPRAAILVALSFVVAGFMSFWLTPRFTGSVALAGLGLLLAGLGVANLLPLTVGRMLALSHGPADRISARSVLAIGTAIALAPSLLGWLADKFGLTNALLMIPALVVAALAIGWITGRDRTD